MSLPLLVLFFFAGALWFWTVMLQMAGKGHWELWVIGGLTTFALLMAWSVEDRRC